MCALDMPWSGPPSAPVPARGAVVPARRCSPAETTSALSTKSAQKGFWLIDCLKSARVGHRILRMQTGHELLLDQMRRIRRAETTGVQVEDPIVIDREGGEGSQRMSLSGICGLEPVATFFA